MQSKMQGIRQTLTLSCRYCTLKLVCLVRPSGGSNVCARSPTAAATTGVPRGHPQAPPPAPGVRDLLPDLGHGLCSSGMARRRRRPAQQRRRTQREVPGRLGVGCAFASLRSKSPLCVEPFTDGFLPKRVALPCTGYTWMCLPVLCL